MIEDLLQGIAPRNKVFLMDTCESGEIDEDLQERYYAMADSKGIKAITTRAITVKSKTKDNPQETTYIRKRDLSIMTFLFSSFKGGEISYESHKFIRLKMGFFTEEIINALTKNVADKNGDGLISTSTYEFRDYVSNALAKQTESKQHPTIDRDNIYEKFGLPMVSQ